MAENKENIAVEETKDTAQAVENDESYDALKSFLESDTSDVLNKEKEKAKKNLKITKGALWIIIGIVCVAIIVGVIFIVNSLPAKQDETNTYKETPMSRSVDEKGKHQAEVLLDDKGKLTENGSGTLLEYTPSDIAKIEVENESGSFTILAETNVGVDENGEETRDATVYTLVGFEGVELQSGGPDTVANDVAQLTFNSVADYKGKNTEDFGFKKPRATVTTTYTDDTTSTIYVGDDAPAQAGTYIMFGDSDTVYLASSDSVDGLLYSVLNLVTLSVNEAAQETSNTAFEVLTLSGTAFDQTIELRKNDDEAINSSFVMVKPEKMFVSEVEASNILGGIRGLFADEAMCVNPSSSQLSKYGLSNPYITLKATYPDTTVNIRASEPVDGYAYIIADSNIVYKLADTKLMWLYTNMKKLVPDVVIDPRFTAISGIKVTDESGTYDLDVVTVTESVDTTEGNTEQVQVTTAKYGDKELDSDNFQVFYQNLCNMTNAGAVTEKASGKPVLTIELSYSTGRANDVIEVYPTGNSKYIANLNGKTTCLVYKSYCKDFSQCVQDLIKDRTVSSF